MTDSSKRLLELINEGKTVNEISLEMGVSNRTLYNHLTMLRNRGFNFYRKYYYNGDIIYRPMTYLDTVEKKGTGVDIITSPKDTEFRAMLLSDLHIGSELETLNLLDEVYNYCIKNDIHIIIIAGDLINGMFGCPSIHKSVDEQIDYMIKNYPFDKNILNFTVLGNHDINSWNTIGQDFSMVLRNYRHDIVPLGYGTGIINVKNDQIVVKHPLVVVPEKDRKYSSRIVLRGHSHKMNFQCNQGMEVSLTIPTLSNVFIKGNQMVPSAVLMSAKFAHGMFTSVEFKQLLFMDKNIYSINEFSSEFANGIEIDHSKPIKLEEERVKKRVFVPTKRDNLSQIEKFNAKYKIQA